VCAQKLDRLKRTQKNIKDPLYRFFEREVSLGASLLETVRADLEDVQLICRGEKKQTNVHRQLTQSLTKGKIGVLR
jgi:dynein heavy chain 1